MTEINIDRVIERLEKATGSPCEAYTEIQNELAIKIKPEHLLDAVAVLRDVFDCYHLTGITAQRREDEKDVIEVLYHFWQKKGLTLRMTLPANAAELPSLMASLPGADFYEREVAEMFGVRYTGREETPPLLLPDDWDQGPPFMREEESDG